MSHQQSEEVVVLQEIPPRCMSTDSAQEVLAGVMSRKKRIWGPKFLKKKLYQAFFRVFICCSAPSAQILDESQANTQQQVPEETDRSSLLDNETHIQAQPASGDNINEDYLPEEVQQLQLNENSICTKDEEEMLSPKISEIYDAENKTTIQHPLSLDISSDISISFSASYPSSEHQKWLLSPILDSDKGKKCLVLDLDETLVHSSFKIIHQADFIVPVKIDSTYHNVYVIKRPGVDSFMKRMGELFEIVIFTASLAKYADPVLDMLDIHHVIKHRLFRESCFNHQGNYVKNLSQLGRELKNVLIIDNSPASYIFHPSHAVPISSWFNDAHDTELLDLIPFLEDLTTVPDVTTVLDLGLM